MFLLVCGDLVEELLVFGDGDFREVRAGGQKGAGFGELLVDDREADVLVECIAVDHLTDDAALDAFVADRLVLGDVLIGLTAFVEDDANELVEKMLSADVIVLATPVYFYSMDAQLKTLIDRTVSRWDDFGRFKGTEFWHIVTAADTNRDMMNATLEGLRGFMRDCMDGSIERGVIYGTGAYEKGEVKKLPVMREAYEAGLSA